MSSNFHFDGSVTQHGGSQIIGMIKNVGPADPQAAFQQMIADFHALRSQVPPADRTAIDESLAVIQSADLHMNRDGLRKALANVVGIAAMVGQVGAPRSSRSARSSRRSAVARHARGGWGAQLQR